MAQSDSGIGNVTPNAALVQMAMSYSRSYMLCAAARLGIADALGDEVRRVDLPPASLDPSALVRDRSSGTRTRLWQSRTRSTRSPQFLPLTRL